MELRARGWTVAAARREVGVSRSTGANWSRGFKIYRKGRVVGFTQPLDRLVVRSISSRYLSQDERIVIADLHQQGLTIRAIAEQIGRSPSTISRELKRNQQPDGSYRPFEAQRRAAQRRAKPRPRRLETNELLNGLVGQLLAQRWSPSQIARHLRARFFPMAGLAAVFGCEGPVMDGESELAGASLALKVAALRSSVVAARSQG